MYLRVWPRPQAQTLRERLGPPAGVDSECIYTTVTVEQWTWPAAVQLNDLSYDPWTHGTSRLRSDGLAEQMDSESLAGAPVQPVHVETTSGTKESSFRVESGWY